MARTYKRIQRSYEDVIQDQLVCDVCKKSTAMADWSNRCHERKEVTVEYRHGDTYPEGDFTKLVTFDLCPDCWEKHLVPFMASLGAKPATRDSEDTAADILKRQELGY